MKFVVSNSEMKTAEENAVKGGVSLLQLMLNAGAICAETLEKHTDVKGKLFVIICGRGNNGGDGYVIAHKLRSFGAETAVIQMFGQPNSPCAMECYSFYKDTVSVLSLSENQEQAKNLLLNAFCIIDCVFGTGYHGDLPHDAYNLFDFINNEVHGVKVAVDIPSGVNSNTGEISPNAFKPHITLALGAIKQGMLNTRSYDFLGEVLLMDIGIGEECFTRFTARFIDETILDIFPKRNKSDHKGTFGKLLNVAGSMDFSGAAVLSTKAALRTGAGLVTLAAPAELVKQLTGKLIENTFISLPQDRNGYISADAPNIVGSHLSSVTAVSAGCGLGDGENTRMMIEYLIKNTNCPIILDADGINSIKNHIHLLKDNDKRLILSPHPKEFSRLCGKSVEEIQNNRIDSVIEFAIEHGVFLLLKGNNTVIATPYGDCWINITGNPALAKGGSGDVLTGIIGSLLAQGLKPVEAAKLGAYLHGLSADMLSEKMSMTGILPTDIIENLPYII